MKLQPRCLYAAACRVSSVNSRETYSAGSALLKALLFLPQMCSRRRMRHQLDEHFVKLFGVEVLLHFCELFALPGLLSRSPDQRVAIACSMVEIDVHIQLLRLGDDRRIEPCRCGDFIPEI